MPAFYHPNSQNLSTQNKSTMKFLIRQKAEITFSNYFKPREAFAVCTAPSLYIPEYPQWAESGRRGRGLGKRERGETKMAEGEEYLARTHYTGPTERSRPCLNYSNAIFYQCHLKT